MKTIIKKGVFFITTSGEYSDYGVDALLQALEDICPEKLKIEYLEYRKECALQLVEPLNWLVNIKKIAIEINFQELHLQSYGRTTFESLREGDL